MYLCWVHICHLIGPQINATSHLWPNWKGDQKDVVGSENDKYNYIIALDSNILGPTRGNDGSCTEARQMSVIRTPNWQDCFERAALMHDPVFYCEILLATMTAFALQEVHAFGLFSKSWLVHFQSFRFSWPLKHNTILCLEHTIK